MLSGFSAGCDDYIAKPFSLEVLRRKIEVILMRTGSERKNIIRYRDLTIDCERASVHLKGEPVKLTADGIPPSEISGGKQWQSCQPRHADPRYLGYR